MEHMMSEIDELRAEISGRISQARILSAHVGRGAAGREVAVVITKLQEANMWLREASELLQRGMAAPLKETDGSTNT